MKRHFFSKMFRTGGKGLLLNPSGRVLKVEDLESRILLTVAQGISADDFNSITKQYAGFDYSSITSSKVYLVDVAADSTSNSLREAIASAQASGGADMIVIKTTDTANTITFSSTNESFVINDSSSLILVAYGSKNLTINAGGKSRIFEIKGTGKTQIANMTLTGGAGNDGGAILNSGKLILDRMDIYNNNASGKGGGIYSSNEIEIVNSIISNNLSQDDGGGIYINKTAYVSTILNNTITNSTIVYNTAGEGGSFRGGGIYFYGGLPTDKTMGAKLDIFNSIIVENSADGKIDSNIYDRLWYLEIVVPDPDNLEATKTQIVETGIPAQIDGFNNLSSFEYWFTDATTSEKTNIKYEAAISLFTNASVRDYTLLMIGGTTSQAIDQGNNSKAVYKNSQKISYDLNGNLRTVNNIIDIGACEYILPNIDLATVNGGQLISETSLVNGNLSIVEGQKLQINGITVTNKDNSFASEKFAIRFYLSEDMTISAEDNYVGKITVDSIAKNSTRYFNSGIFLTGGMSPGKTFYVGWIIGADEDGSTLKDDTLTNNVACCTTKINVLTTAASIEAITIKKGANTIQQGSELYLAADTDNFDNLNVTYWWDYGNGYFVKGEKASYVSANQIVSKTGVQTIKLQIVNNETGNIVGKGSSSLTIQEAAPTILTEQIFFLSNTLLKLDINVSCYNRNVQQWSINWGDGTSGYVSSANNANDFSLVMLHYYSKNGSFNATLSLTDSNGNGADVVYTLAVVNVSSYASTSQAVDNLSSETEINLSQAEELQISESAPLTNETLAAAPALDLLWENTWNSEDQSNGLPLISSAYATSGNEKNTEFGSDSNLKKFDISFLPVIEKEKKASFLKKNFSPEELEDDYLEFTVLPSTPFNEKDDDLFDFLNEDEF